MYFCPFLLKTLCLKANVAGALHTWLAMRTYGKCSTTLPKASVDQRSAEPVRDLAFDVMGLVDCFDVSAAV